MKKRRKPLLFALVLALSLAFVLPLQAAAAPAEPAPPAADEATFYPQPVFDPDGPDGTAGVWAWLAGEGEWYWIPGQKVEPGFTASSIDATEQPAWPSQPWTLWVAPGPAEGQYWVWDVYTFGGSGDYGPSIWAPRWRLVTEMSPLGVTVGQ
ncbi:MAG: hypothetical protein ACYC1C_18180 [Chloroflexota bacterium]